MEQKTISPALNARYGMAMEINRRTFLIVLGAVTATAGRPGGPRRQTCRLSSNGTPLYYFATACPEPPARPRTAAVTYLTFPSS